jgi:uncharacterized protein
MDFSTALVGASPKKDRYAYMAFNLLKEKGYQVYPVNPAYSEIDGTKVFSGLTKIEKPVHTVTLYLAADKQMNLEQDILAIKPVRVIFNPGSENPDLEEKLEKQGVHCIEACTLVLLKTKQYEKPGL